MNIEIYTPEKPEYSKVYEVDTLEQAALKVRNNLYISDYLWRGVHSNELEYIKHAIMEVRASKSGEGIITWCAQNDSAYAKVVN